MMFFTKVIVVILALFVLDTLASPSRVRRQGFSWGDFEDEDQVLTTQSQRQRPTRPPRQSPTPDSSNGGTTTTTPSPQYSSCIQRCPTTPQYNPICGTNRITYPNESHLRCANNCGLNVQRAFGGTCSPL